MNFITIDFETATSARNSACEIGLTFVRDGQVTDTQAWLIKPASYPHFDAFNTYIHGIRPQDVADQPTFPVVWKEVRPWLENQLVIAHNASFDMSVLRRTLETYDIPFPSFRYACSYLFSKKVWPGMPAYDLKTLCKANDITFKHHRAGSDSRACAELALKALSLTGTRGIDEFSSKLEMTVGLLFQGGYTPCQSQTRRSYPSKAPMQLLGNPARHDAQSLFYGKTVVFTGTLSSLSRSEAQQLIADIGGVNAGSVTKDTDFLVVGQQDYRVVGEDGLSGKQEKAIRMIAKGAALEILSEADFLRNIAGEVVN
jgi:DNA polymerase-3 subunit epsilon